MAQSSLLGAERAPGYPPGHDTQSLGPSDTSDSGSDVAGLETLDENDPAMPIDAGLNPDIERPEESAESIGAGIDSDAAGTGERRSAGADPGLRDGSDIAPDRIVDDPNGSDFADEADDLRARAASRAVSDPLDDSTDPRADAARNDALLDEAIDASAEEGALDDDTDEDDDADDGRDRAGTAVPPSDPSTEPRSSDEGVNDEGDEELPAQRG
jgi:hypothetical protein